MKRRFFTLLEVLVAVALLLMASGVIGWKMHAAVQKKQWQSQLDRVRERLMVAQKLAVTMQADWRASFTLEDGGWALELYCEESRACKFAPLHIRRIPLFFNGRPLEKLALDFFASGKVSPEGVFSFPLQGGGWVVWQHKDLFKQDTGEKFGPIYPNG